MGIAPTSSSFTTVVAMKLRIERPLPRYSRSGGHGCKLLELAGDYDCELEAAK